MKPKFQPMPSSVSSSQKCPTVIPVSETPAAAAISTKPAAAMVERPKRVMSLPVKKLGPNMASTWKMMPIWASATEWPQSCTMASGAAVITKLIIA
ncbi:hypothetical protein D3C87_1687750 [compost metagenome]